MPCCRNRRVSVRTVAGWVCGFPGPLLRGPVGEEDHRADDFIAPLRVVHKLQLQLRKVLGWHAPSPPAAVVHRGDL